MQSLPPSISSPTSSGEGVPSYHVVDIDGDRGSPDYNRCCVALWKALCTIDNSHRLQAMIGDVTEHTLELMALASASGGGGDDIVLLGSHPLVALCREAFPFSSVATSTGRPPALPVDKARQQQEKRNRDAGIVLPNSINSQLVFDTLECLTYRHFYESFDHITKTVSRGDFYSACESRWSVLRCRFRLHRAFNADIEDHGHLLLAGGDVAQAAKADIRRIGTCVAATTVVEFLKQKIAEVSRRAEASTTTSGEGDRTPGGAGRTHTTAGGGASISSDEAALLASVETYFGPNRPEAERLLTAEGLSLKPNFAQVSDERIDIYEKNNPMRPRGDHALQVLKHVLKFQYGHEGQWFADMIRPVLSSPNTLRSNEFLELELTVHGLRKGEIAFLANWCERIHMYALEPRIRLCLRVVLMRIDADDDSKYGQCSTLADVLANVFESLWDGLLRPDANPSIARFLTVLNAISVAVDDANDTQDLPLPGAEWPNRYTLRQRALLPPDALFFFLVWRNTQLLNLGILSALLSAVPTNPGGAAAAVVMDRSLQFRIHSDNKLRSYPHCTAALLISDTIVNPMRIAQWSPLGYLYYLTQRHVVLTPSVNNAMTSPFSADRSKAALVALLEVGANVSVASMDPLHHHTTDVALCEELGLLQKVFHLSATDVTEMCLRSVENANLSVREVKSVYPNSIRWTSARTGVELLALQSPAGVVAPLGGGGSATQGPALRGESAADGGRKHHQSYWLLHSSVTGTTSGGGGGGVNNLDCVQGFHYHSHRRNHSVDGLYNRIYETQVPSARLLFRERCHEHELVLLRAALQRHGSTSASLPTRRLPLRHVYPPTSEAPILFPRLHVRGPHVTQPSRTSTALIEILALRERYRSHSAQALAEQKRVRLWSSPSQAQQQRLLLFADSSNSGSPSQIRDVTAFTGAEMCQGVFFPVAFDGGVPVVDTSLPTWSEYMQDYRALRLLVHDPKSHIFAKRRLLTLEHKFRLHRALMDSAEHYHHDPLREGEGAGGQPAFGDEGASNPVSIRPNSSDSRQVAPDVMPVSTSAARAVRDSRSAHEFSDMYRCVRVDVHCHMASGMTAKQLLEFMQRKARENPDDIVGIDAAGTRAPITLRDLLLSITRKRFGPDAQVEDLTVSALDVQATSGTFNRFDHFNNKYNPLGLSALRSLFLKTDNFMGGRYFAEIIKATFERQRQLGNVFSEFRLSIYGRSRQEWRLLAQWWAAHGMNHRVNRWMIQIPRIYNVYHNEGSVASFGQLLHNVFAPLWDVTLRPDSDPILSSFLEHVSGFDSVDNESGRETDPTTIATPPEAWKHADNPPFAYWMFYMWSNLASLNRVRSAKQLNTFAFRPHCGESGDPDHLIDAFFLAEGIGHGVQLKRRSVLQYLFYLTQIGLGMTPLSNNALFCRYHENPFPEFFARGLHVALSTDGPLQFHHTDDPLTEEYATAIKFWDLSTVDACEIASNSVRMSGFPDAQKRAWLGDLYRLRSTAGNEAAKSRIPHSRVAFRYEVYDNECRYLEHRAARLLPHRAMLSVTSEDLWAIEEVGLTRLQVLERRARGLPVVRSAPLRSTNGDNLSKL